MTAVADEQPGAAVERVDDTEAGDRAAGRADFAAADGADDSRAVEFFSDPGRA